MMNPVDRHQALNDLDVLIDDADWSRVLSRFIEAEESLLSSVCIYTQTELEYTAVMAVLDKKIWRMSPLMTTGRPYTDSDAGHVWLLTNVFEVPGIESDEIVFDRKDPSNWEDIRPLHPLKDLETINRLKSEGYEYLGQRKDEVTLVKYRLASRIPANLQEKKGKPTWDWEIELAKIMECPVEVFETEDPPTQMPDVSIEPVWRKPGMKDFKIMDRNTGEFTMDLPDWVQEKLHVRLGEYTESLIELVGQEVD